MRRACRVMPVSDATAASGKFADLPLDSYFRTGSSVGPNRRCATAEEHASQTSRVFCPVERWGTGGDSATATMARKKPVGALTVRTQQSHRRCSCTVSDGLSANLMMFTHAPGRQTDSPGHSLRPRPPGSRAADPHRHAVGTRPVLTPYPLRNSYLSENSYRYSTSSLPESRSISPIVTSS